MKIKSYRISQTESKDKETTYSLEVKIEFKQKKDMDELVRIIKDNLR